MKSGLGRSILVGLSMVVTSVLATVLQPGQAEASKLPPLDLEAMIPSHFGVWAADSTVQPIQAEDPGVQSLVDSVYDALLSRSYTDGNGNLVMLLVAYGSDQTGRLRVHRPESCYAAQGFMVKRSSDVPMLEGTQIEVKRLVASLGSRNEPITYWIRIGDQNVKSLWGQRLEQLRYGLTGSVPDGVLFRVSSYSDDPRRAYELQDRFVRDLFAQMSPKDRDRLIAGWSVQG